MSNIDKRALREAAERATSGKWERGDGNGNGGELLVYSDDALGSAVCEMTSEYNAIPKYQRINNLNFIAAANPATVLGLLDELEAKDAQIANLTAERDALREGAMGDAKHSNTRAAADIYFQLVEECEIPAGGSLVEYVSVLRERAEAGKGEAS